MSDDSWRMPLKEIRMKELSERKKAELRLIAQSTFEATLAAAKKYARATRKARTRAVS